MTRTIAIASGKGGVGKTTIVANLGLAIAKLGKKVIMIDADLDMANLELALGMEGRPITLQDVLKGEAGVNDAVYEVNDNAYFIPAGISPSKFRRVDPEKFAEVIKTLDGMADFVLLDCPAGIGKDTIACFSSCKETILIMTPDPLSITDAYKTSITASKMEAELSGVIINMIKNAKGELKEKEITSLLNSPILARINYDNAIAESVFKGKPLVLNDVSNEFSNEVMKLASKLTGVPYIPEKPKKSLFSKIFNFLKKR